MQTLPFAHVVGLSAFLDHFAHLAFGFVVIVGVFAFYARERRKLRRQAAINEERFALVFGQSLTPETSRSQSGDAALWAAATTLAVAGLIHAGVASAHFGLAAAFGVFFAVSGALQLCGAVLVLAMPSRLVLVAVAAGSAALVLLWLLTRTTGLPIGPEAWEAQPVGALDLVSSSLELVTVVASMLAARRCATRPTRRTVALAG